MELKQHWIRKALYTLVQTATSRNLLFLEEDWQIKTDQLRGELQFAEQMLDTNFVDVVKFRSSVDPGKPYCSAVWRGFEHLMQEEAMQGGDGVLSILNAASWQQDDARVKQLFGGKWRCHPNFLCGHSPVSLGLTIHRCIEKIGLSRICLKQQKIRITLKAQ